MEWQTDVRKMSKIGTSHQVSGADSEGLENGADLDPRIQVRHKTPPVYNEGNWILW